MNEKQINNFIKLSLIMAGMIITSIMLFLYMTEEDMGKRFQNGNFFVNVAVLLFFAVIISMFIAICVLILRESKNEYDYYIFDNKPFILIKNNSREDSHTSYDDLKSALKNAENGDVLYINDSEFSLNAKDLIIKDKLNNTQKEISLSLTKNIPIFSITVQTKKLKGKTNPSDKNETASSKENLAEVKK